MNRPNINVTPLIDVLLVLLIIFMVITPLKPSAFKARVPAERRQDDIGQPNPHTLVVAVERDGSLLLNRESGLGTVDEPDKLDARLRQVFETRIANGDVSELFADSPERPFPDKAERSVFIKAPVGMAYGDVARVVDTVKAAGAFPIGLQIDDLH